MTDIHAPSTFSLPTPKMRTCAVADADISCAVVALAFLFVRRPTRYSHTFKLDTVRQKGEPRHSS